MAEHSTKLGVGFGARRQRDNRGMEVFSYVCSAMEVAGANS